VTAFESEIPTELREAERPDYHRALAEIALAEARAEDAIDEFGRSDTGYCILCPLPGLARAHETAGDTDAAIVAYERYVETPWFYRFFGNEYAQGPLLGPAYERLGQLHYEEGDLESAAKYYAMFVELWAEADEELQPRVRTAQARLEEIVRERG
jgi:tetratricopeptide (TPR) repeat protein